MPRLPKPPQWLALLFIAALLLGYLWIELGHHVVPGSASLPHDDSHSHTHAEE